MIRDITIDKTERGGVSYFTVTFFVKFKKSPVLLFLDTEMSKKETITALINLTKNIIDYILL